MSTFSFLLTFLRRLDNRDDPDPFRQRGREAGAVNTRITEDEKKKSPAEEDREEFVGHLCDSKQRHGNVNLGKGPAGS